MAYEFKLPDIGEGVVEGEIVSWLVAEGDEVGEDQPLVEIMTDKATVAIPSPRAGKVVETRGGEGDRVEVGDVLCVIDEGAGGEAGEAEAEEKKAQAADEDEPEEKRAQAEPKRQGASRPDTADHGDRPGKKMPKLDDGEQAPQTRAKAPQPEGPPARLDRGLPGRATSPLAAKVSRPAPERRAAAPARAAEPAESGSAAGLVAASPSVRRKARELGVDLSSLQGAATGRITHDDLEHLARGNGGATGGPAPRVERPAAPPPPTPEANMPPGVSPPPHGEETRVKFRGVRRKIAERMQESKNTAAHFTFVEEVDMRKLVALRASLKEAAARRGVKLTYLPFFVKASVEALKLHPQLNCTVDTDADEIVYRGYYNIGMAAATERGLMVPVIKDADARSLLDIAGEIERLAEAARSGKIGLDELQGSTFTITSLGAQGGLFATPVINFPEVAIMGIHQIKDKPVIEDGAVVPGKVMLLSLSFDHRIVDGHIGAAFAYEVIRFLENPEELFLELS